MSNLVKFKELQIQNFKSFGPKETIDFSKHHGLNYVCGTNKDIEGTSNGSGKSNIFCAVLFALFGKTINNTNNRFIPNRVITDKKLITDVILDFEVNGSQYRIRTFIKHRRHPYIASCQLWKDGIEDEHEITKSSVRETRRYVERQILKCSYELFKSSVILSSSDSRNFFKMGKHQKREYVENIFELSVFGEMLTTIRTDINKLDKEILTVQKECNQQKNSLLEFNVKNNDFDVNQKIIIKQLASSIRNKKDEVEKLKVSLTDEELENDFSNVINDYPNQIKKIEDGELKIDSIIRRLKGSIESHQREIDKHGEVLQIICEDCKKAVENKYSINDCHSIINDSKDKIDAHNVSLGILEKRRIVLRGQSHELDEKINASKKLSKEIEQNKWDRKQLITSIKEIAGKIKEEQEKQSPFSDLIDKYQIEVDEKDKLLQEYFTEKAYLETLHHVVSEDGAKKFIIKDLVEILNQLIRKYLEEMGADFTCVFDTSFDVVFLTNTGECEYSSFSAGERQRLIIATLLSFRDILNSGGTFESNLFILDELIDANVDNYCIQSLVNILNKQVEDKNTTIFVISHRETVRPEDFDNIIEVQKKNSISTIVSDPQGGITLEE